MSTKLKDEEVNELKQLLSDIQINTNKLNREFADAVLMAKLMKKFYPKLIDLHNYSSCNNTQRKLDNWTTLNVKVLSKLGLQQKYEVLTKLSQGVPGEIEVLLRVVMNHSKKNIQQRVQRVRVLGESDVITINVKKRINDSMVVQLPQKMISYSIYERVRQEYLRKDSCVKAARQKLVHLENSIKLQNERIDELQAQLAMVSVKNLLKKYNVESLKPNSAVNLNNSYYNDA